MPNLILTKEQARAVFDAMCALNNVGGTVDIKFTKLPGNKSLRVMERNDGCVSVDVTGNFRKDDEAERYHSQSAFATAYNLEQTA